MLGCLPRINVAGNSSCSFYDTESIAVAQVVLVDGHMAPLGSRIGVYCNHLEPTSLGCAASRNACYTVCKPCGVAVTVNVINSVLLPAHVVDRMGLTAPHNLRCLGLSLL
jgi:hypothetical protein